jgi:hypothetical protein
LEKKIKISLPRARGEALGKDFSKKRTILCWGPTEMALGKDGVHGAGTVVAAFLCRVPPWPSAKALLSAR